MAGAVEAGVQYTSSSTKNFVSLFLLFCIYRDIGFIKK